MSTINASGLPIDASKTIEAFRAAAPGSDTLTVQLVGGSLAVLGRSAFDGATRKRDVAWVQADQTDSAALFLQALQDTYGTGISARVAREFGLQPAPGEPLCARTVEQALVAAETGKKALGGVDFLTMLEHSAATGGPAFKAAARQLGIDTARLDGRACARIDGAMRQKFERAAADGASPISTDTASEWLIRELNLLTN